MEGLVAPPPTGDGLVFVLNSAQRELALKQHIVGTTIQRLPLVKAATKGQPVFIFDHDARALYGPYAAEGPGELNIDKGNSRLPAQLRFSTVVRQFLPLPETAVSDLLSMDGQIDGKGRRPANYVDSAAVGQLLLLFVLHTNGLFDLDEEDAEAPEEPPLPPQRAPAAPRPGGSRGRERDRERSVRGKGGRGGGS